VLSLEEQIERLADEAYGQLPPYEGAGSTRANDTPRPRRTWLAPAAAAMLVTTVGLVWFANGRWAGTEHSAPPGSPSTEVPVETAAADRAYDVVSAKVVAAGSTADQIEIDRGRRDGIRVGSSAIARGGLVGTVQQVDDETSVVLLLSAVDYRSAAVVYVADPEGADRDGVAGVEGVIVGQGSGERVLFQITESSEFVDRIELDALVVASGIPRGVAQAKVPIGTVSRLPNPGSSLNVEIQTGARLNDLTEVDVLVVR
jgi:rod shape-determining protein MreC